MIREVQYDGVGAFRIRFAYDRDLVERIKSLPRRRWIAAERYWSVPDGDVVELVEMLNEHDFRFDVETISRYRDRGGTVPLDESRSSSQPGLFEDAGAEIAGEPTPDYSVSRLNEEVRRAIERAFPQAVWLVGEISSFNRGAHKRHVSFQLVEHDDAGENLSSIGATLFEHERTRLEQLLRDAGDPFKLEDEVTVRVRARVSLYVPWGSYRVVIEELDVAYTLGEAARRREEIIRQLTEEDLVGRNPALRLSPVPLRVGLITSIGSDAYNDVLRTFQESGMAFEIVVHGARVQGRSTEPSVLNALDDLRRRDLDVVLICRGGGSRMDLAWFDSLALGRAVARFPIPVVVGIGHEQDQSVLDAVARRAKTPTAAAALVVEQVGTSLRRLEATGLRALELAAQRTREETALALERALRLTRASRGLLSRELAELRHRRQRGALAVRGMLTASTERLSRLVQSIPRAGAVLLTQHSERVAAAIDALGPRASRILQHERERAVARERRLSLVHPRRVLERGYAIVRLEDGTVVTRASMAPEGATLRATLGEGSLLLRSRGAEPDEGGT